MGQPTKDEICNFIDRACSSSTNEELYLCTIDFHIAQVIKQSIPLTLTDYQVIISEEYVRHVKNRHKEDLKFICLIPEIINAFDSVSKSID